MERMEYVKLGDIVSHKKGFAFSSSDYKKEGTMVVRVSDFTLDSIGKNEAVFIENKESYNDFKLKTGDILVQTVGSWANNPNSIVGKVVRVPSDCNGSLLNQNIVKLIPNNDIDKTYLFYALKGNKFSDFCVIRGQGAANQASITLDTVMRFKFSLHNEICQKKIANILSRYDEAIENNNKRIKLLEQMAQNLYKEWFVRFRFPGWENCEFENGIPVGWNFQKLEDFGIVLESGSRPSGGVNINLEEGIPSLGAECIKGLAEFDYSNIKYIPLEFYDKMKRGKNKGNHILLYKDGAYIGKVTLFRNQFPFKKYAINEHVFFLNSKNSNYLNWLFFTLKQDSYFNLMQNLNRNAAQPGLSQPDICRIKIRIPQEDIVIKFNQIVEPILNTVFYLAKTNKNLAKQRDLLLPRLMSGKLEVN